MLIHNISNFSAEGQLFFGQRRIEPCPHREVHQNEKNHDRYNFVHHLFRHLCAAHLLRVVHQLIDRGNLDEQRHQRDGETNNNEPPSRGARARGRHCAVEDAADADEEEAQREQVEEHLLRELDLLLLAEAIRGRTNRGRNQGSDGTECHAKVHEAGIVPGLVLDLSRIAWRQKILELQSVIEVVRHPRADRVPRIVVPLVDVAVGPEHHHLRDVDVADVRVPHELVPGGAHGDGRLNRSFAECPSKVFLESVGVVPAGPDLLSEEDISGRATSVWLCLGAILQALP
mmetsp:Transcript_47032/g.99955  ORF Transcript_47032/g.99955 Transcript_47032/m.99955 type:complete len:287 (-) Transcript_47032:472-1332(-)